MKSFLNNASGAIEHVPDVLVSQYEKRPEKYTPVSDTVKHKEAPAKKSGNKSK